MRGTKVSLIRYGGVCVTNAPSWGPRVQWSFSSRKLPCSDLPDPDFFQLRYRKMVICFATCGLTFNYADFSRNKNGLPLIRSRS